MEANGEHPAARNREEHGMSELSSNGIKKKKEIILQTANLMRERKLETITVRMICGAAHVSIGTFYHYFKKKENVVIGIFKLIDDYIESRLIPTLNSEDETENVVNYCRGFADYAENLGVGCSRAVNSIFPAPGGFSRDAEKRRPLYRELQKLIRRGIEKGQIGRKYGPGPITDAILLMLRGVDFDWARRGGDYSLPDRVERLARGIAGLLKPAGKSGAGNRPPSGSKHQKTGNP